MNTREAKVFQILNDALFFMDESDFEQALWDALYAMPDTYEEFYKKKMPKELDPTDLLHLKSVLAVAR